MLLSSSALIKRDCCEGIWRFSYIFIHWKRYLKRWICQRAVNGITHNCYAFLRLVKSVFPQNFSYNNFVSVRWPYSYRLLKRRRFSVRRFFFFFGGRFTPIAQPCDDIHFFLNGKWRPIGPIFVFIDFSPEILAIELLLNFFYVYAVSVALQKTDTSSLDLPVLVFVVGSNPYMKCFPLSLLKCFGLVQSTKINTGGLNE